MKIFIICSKSFYPKVLSVKYDLELKDHEVILPNCFDKPETEDEMRSLGRKEYAKWKRSMILHSRDVISDCDAVLVLNYDKNGISNYIGGATFLEMYDAFRLNKKIFMMNDFPEGILKDELISFHPVIINGNLLKVV